MKAFAVQVGDETVGGAVIVPAFRVGCALMDTPLDERYGLLMLQPTQSSNPAAPKPPTLARLAFMFDKRELDNLIGELTQVRDALG